MKSTNHFLNILLSLPSKHSKGEIVSITIETLTGILYCTPRNVNLIIRKLENEGFIEWKAGVGRGNPSQMTLLKDLEEVAEEYFHELLDKDKIKEAMDLLYNNELPVSLSEKFRILLDNRFGCQVEQTSSALLEVLRVTTDRKVTVLDPAFARMVDEVFFLEQISDRLVSFDTSRKTYLPALAHSWESNDDGSRWTFYLRKGVRFHHGRMLTAKDVLHSVQRLKNVDSPSRWQYEQIERIEIVSDHVISFYLRNPNRLFLNFFGSFYMSILPYDVDFSEKDIISTGPFRLAKWTDHVLVLEAFDDYFGERALLDRVEVWFIPDSGGGHEQYHIQNQDGKEQDLNRQDEEFEYVMTGCQFITFNFRKEGIHHNSSFRKILRIIYDQLAIIEELKGYRSSPATSFLPEKSKDVHKQVDTYTKQQMQDQLLKSGYAGETLKLYYFDKKDQFEDANWLQQRCESVGLKISLHKVPDDRIGLEKEADLLLMNIVLEDDIEWGYLNLFQNESSLLRCFLNSAQREWLDCYLSYFVRVSLPEQRTRIIDEIESRIRDDNWLLFGYHKKKISQFDTSMKGMSLDSYGWIDLSKLWIKQELLDDSSSTIHTLNTPKLP